MGAPSPRRSADCPNGEHGDRDAACSGDGIPVVDLDILLNGDADQRSQAIWDLGRACEDRGCFMVIKHGVPEVLQEAVMEACKELFDLPTEEKAEYMDAGPMDPISIGMGSNSLVDGAKCWRDYVKIFTHPEFFCPPKPSNLRDSAMEYSACTSELLLELTKAIFESLGLDGGHISDALNLGSCFQNLVGNYYPAYSGPDDGAIGVPAHSNHGLLTLLFQNGVDGLQVEHDGRWLLVKPFPGSLFVNTGDQLEILSNGRYKGVLHRAVVGEQARMSVTSLIGPCLDAVVEPVPELPRNSPQGLVFRGIKYRDYLEHRRSSKINEKAALDIARV